MMKKVIYIFTPQNSPNLIGGTNRRIVNWLTNSEFRKNDNILLISGHNRNESDKIVKAYKNYGINAIYINNLTFPKYLLPWNFFRFYRFLKKEKPAIIHSLLVQSDILGGFAKMMKLTKYHISSIEGALYPKNTYKSYLYNIAFNIVKNQIDQYITLCNYTKKQAFQLYGVNKNKITIIKSGIALDKFPLKKYKSFNKENKQIIIGFLGRIDNEKCIHLFIDTALYLINNNYSVKFIIGGTGPELEHIKERVLKNSDQDKFKILGFVSDTNVFFESIDILLFLSVGEGLPWTILEAQAKGVIVVASSVGGVPEIIENEVNGFLIKDNNVIDISSKIELIVNGRFNLNELILNGRRNIENNFEYSLEVKNVLSIYEKI